jgi:hypothetical protein
MNLFEQTAQISKMPLMEDPVICPDCGTVFENFDACPCKIAKLEKLEAKILRVSNKLWQLKQQYQIENRT